MSSLLVKTKTPLSHQRDKGVNLCGTTLLAGKAQRSGHSGMPGNGGGPEGPTAVSALCSKGIFPASSRPPCTKRRLSVRLGGGYSAFSAHSCDILSYLIRFPAACQEFYCQFCAPGAYWLWRRGRTGEDTRPYENTGSCPVNAVGAGPRPARPGTKCGSGRAGEDTRPYEDTGSCPANAVGAGPRPARRSRILFGIRRRGQAPALQKTDAQKSGRKPFKAGGPVCRPYGGERTGSVGSATPGAGAGPQQRQFLQGQGPVARREFRHSLRFCAPKIQCQAKGVTLVMGVLGGGRHGGSEALPNLPIAPTP